MAIFYLLIFALVLLGAKIVPLHLTNSTSRNCTNCIKGIFILMVFLSHSWGYIYESNPEIDILDRIFISINSKFGQLIVVMFLFYSGYGVMYNIIHKKDTYINSIPHKRMLVTLANFAIAVSIFILLNLMLSREVTISQALLSLIGWDSVGNSNWYIFCIVCCYAFTYIAFKLSRNLRTGLLILAALSLGYIYVISQFKGSWWYDTVLCYWAGASFAVLFPKLTSVFENQYWYCLTGSIVLFLVFYNLPWDYYALAFNISGIFFALTTVLITMRIQIGNTALDWLGRNLFPLYIYQRLPMILFANLGISWLTSYSPVFVTLCFATTIGITQIYQKVASLNCYNWIKSKLVSID